MGAKLLTPKTLPRSGRVGRRKEVRGWRETESSGLHNAGADIAPQLVSDMRLSLLTINESKSRTPPAVRILTSGANSLSRRVRPRKGTLTAQCSEIR
jgi:hypothetical protein